jgi:hypothetical protein
MRGAGVGAVMFCMQVYPKLVKITTKEEENA